MAYTVALDANALLTLAQTKHFLGISLGEPQTIDVTCKSETEDDLGAKYFTFASTLQEYKVWFDVANSNSEPTVGDTTGVEVDLSNTATAEAVAAAVASAVTSLSDVTATADEATVTIVNGSDGPVTEPGAGTTTFDIVVQEEGSHGDEKQDEKLTSLINEISEFFNTECNRDLASRSITEYFDGADPYVLWFRHPPVAGLTLYTDSDRSFGSTTEITAADYELDPTSGRLELIGTAFVQDFRTTKAVYTGGYTTVPGDLVRACLIKLSQENFMSDQNAYHVAGRSDGAGGVTSYEEDRKFVKRVIGKYRKHQL